MPELHLLNGHTLNKKLLISIIAIFLIAVSACNNKTADKEIQIKSDMKYADIFHKMHESKPEMIYSIEYYKNKIIAFQKMIPESRNINIITNIDDIIPGSLCFLVGWNDFNIGRGTDFDIIANNYPRGNFFGLYTFDTNQNITNEYLVGYKNYLENIRDILLEKIPGKKYEYGLISVGDFNNDSINEIASIYLHPPLFEYVFTVFGYDIAENDFIPVLLAPLYINFIRPFPSVEHIGNGFKILQVVESEPLELAWKNYIWDINSARYVMQ